MTTLMNYEILDWDTQFFGIKTARITDPDLPIETVAETLSELKNRGVRLVYWFSNHDCRYVDVKKLSGSQINRRLTFGADLRDIIVDGSVSSQIVEPYSSSMPISDMEALAVMSGQHSRFVLDPGFSNEQFVALYKTWINRALHGEIAQEVLVVREEKAVAGMVVLGDKDGIGSIDLIAVKPKHRGKAHGYALVRAAQRWFIDRGYTMGHVVTQQRNVSACNLYKKCGYAIVGIKYTYHFWI